MQIHVRAPVSKPLCLSSYRASFVNSYSSVQVRPGAPFYQGRDVIVSISACDADSTGANPVALTILNPVGRLVQAAVCKTAETSAILVRDSTSSSIGVDRYTLVAVRKDLPSRITGRDTLLAVC